MDWIVGVDEVGRGPLAGPVTVCALALSKNAKWFKSFKIPLKDSKKLSVSQRELWLKEIKKAEKRGEVFYVARSVGVKTIDQINIKQAADLAATRAFQKLSLDIYKKHKKNKILKIVTSERRRAQYPLEEAKRVHSILLRQESFRILVGNMEIVLDAGLRINIPNLKQKSFPKADEKVPAVSLASIVAKVKRDKYMDGMDKKYPGYGFAAHKGYGTAAHYRALKKHGPAAVHRLTFLSNLVKLNKK
jgi:ribonuclease HII